MALIEKLNESESESTYSYSFGQTTEPLQYQTLGQILVNSAKAHPNRLAIISHHEAIEVTFSQFGNDVEKLARSCARKLRVTKNDTVAIMSASSYNFILVQYACAKLGAIFCPINALYTIPELEDILMKAKPKVLFLPGPGSQQEKSVRKFYHFFMGLQGDVAKSLEHLVLLDGTLIDEQPEQVQVHQLNHLLSCPINDANYVRFSNIDPDDDCSLFFTSGSTGPSKGVVQTHFALTNSSRFFGHRVDLGGKKNAILCLPVPLSHVLGSAYGAITMTACSVTIVLSGYRFDVQSVVESIIQYNCTHLIAVPTMMIDIINHLKESGLKITCLTHVIIAGAMVTEQAARKYCEAMPSIEKLYIGYGTSEALFITVPKLISAKSNWNNVGQPLDFVEVKIVDSHSDDIVPTGERGELLVRSPYLFRGYFGDELGMAKNFTPSHWYRSGDLASMDEEGFIRIVGRSKDIIIRGGMNILPREIEEVLMSNQLIVQAAVCGVPDARLGEEICAWIRFHDQSKTLSQEEIKAFCKEKIADFKIPRKLLFVNEFPLTASGKIDKILIKKTSSKVFPSLE